MPELRFRETGGPLGAFVDGFSPTAGDRLPVDEILAALARRGVLIIRGESVPADRFVALGRAMGELEILPEPEKRHPDHPEIFNLSNVGPDGGVVTFEDPQSVFLRGTQRWHTDSSFRKIPCLATMLNALTVPTRGGETEFADMTAACRALPQARRTELERLTVVHSYEYSRANNPGDMDPMSDEERAKYPPVHHPLIRRLADGRRSLYLGGHASHVVGMAEAEGRELLTELVEFATQAQFVHCHRWQTDDLVMWDNRSTLHRLRPYDIATDARVMQRITVAGTEPVV